MTDLSVRRGGSDSSGKGFGTVAAKDFTTTLAFSIRGVPRTTPAESTPYQRNAVKQSKPVGEEFPGSQVPPESITTHCFMGVCHRGVRSRTDPSRNTQS